MPGCQPAFDEPPKPVLDGKIVNVEILEFPEGDEAGVGRVAHHYPPARTRFTRSGHPPHKREGSSPHDGLSHGSVRFGHGWFLLT